MRSLVSAHRFSLTSAASLLFIRLAPFVYLAALIPRVLFAHPPSVRGFTVMFTNLTGRLLNASWPVISVPRLLSDATLGPTLGAIVEVLPVAPWACRLVLSGPAALFGPARHFVLSSWVLVGPHVDFVPRRVRGAGPYEYMVRHWNRPRRRSFQPPVFLHSSVPRFSCDIQPTGGFY